MISGTVAPKDSLATGIYRATLTVRTSGGMSVPDNDQEASEPKKEILGKKKSIVGRLRRHQAEIAAKEGKPVSKYLEMQLEREKKK